MDLRARIVRAVGNGLSKAEAARRYDVGLSTVKRYVRQRAAPGHLRAKRHPGRARAIPVADEAALGRGAGRCGEPGHHAPRLRPGRAAAQKSRCLRSSGTRRNGRHGAQTAPRWTRRR